MNRPKAYITRRIPQEAIDIVAAACDYAIWDHEDQPAPRELLLREAAASDGVLALLSDRIDAEFLDAAPRCRVVADMAVGYDNADVPELTRRGVLLTNTPGVLTETTADLAWALLMAAGRRIVEGHKLIEAGGWTSWSPMFMVGQDIHGATLGIVGAGRIGGTIARRAAGFGMRVIYHNRRPAPELERQVGALGVPIEYVATLEDLLPAADYVVVTVPLTDATRGMFGAGELAHMNQTAV
jgi:glyoxylate reductase